MTPGEERDGESSIGVDQVGGWPAVLGALFKRQDLSSSTAEAALRTVLAGEASPAQIAAFAAALRTKGETVDEMVGLVRAMRAFSERVEIAGELVDTCGTGGDRSGTVNVSTMAALVVAAGGALVCKHGNRAASSMAGSADVLEQLGVVIDLGPDGVRRCVEEAGIGFCFAQKYHAALRHAGPVRRELGAGTMFNFLGPLSNPASPARQLIGVGDPAMAGTMLAVLEANGVVRAMAVFGHDGLDELSTVTSSTVLETELVDGAYRRRTYDIDPREFGFAPAALAELQGGDAGHNAGAARAVLSGAAGPQRDFLLLNAGAALVVAGVSADIGAGIERAGALLDSGAVAERLDRLVAISHAAAGGGGGAGGGGSVGGGVPTS
jgi:anthranilate phosphoribosyltransferase